MICNTNIFITEPMYYECDMRDSIKRCMKYETNDFGLCVLKYGK